MSGISACEWLGILSLQFGKVPEARPEPDEIGPRCVTECRVFNRGKLCRFAQTSVLSGLGQQDKRVPPVAIAPSLSHRSAANLRSALIMLKHSSPIIGPAASPGAPRARDR
jgi:hypothetical protein